MMITNLRDNLDYYIPNPKCELVYNKDYELLISVMLSAQTTDKRVNEVTKELYKYNLNEKQIFYAFYRKNKIYIIKKCEL